MRRGARVLSIMSSVLEAGAEIIRWNADSLVDALSTRRALAVDMLCLAVLFVAVLREGLAPFRSTRLVQGVLATAAITLLNIVLSPTALLLLVPIQRGYDWLGIPHLPSSVWEHVPVFLLPPLVVFCRDFVDYWNHRAMHLRWVWPIHAMHHSDPDVTALTSYRIHVLEAVFMRTTQLFALSSLGFPKGALGSAGVVLLLHNAYVHIRLDWSHGPFRYLLASPRFHRWHHADVPALYGKNLANVFPFFDLLWGTYHDPGPCRAPMGVQGLPQNDVAKLMLFPFSEWGRMVWGTLRSSR